MESPSFWVADSQVSFSFRAQCFCRKARADKRLPCGLVARKDGETRQNMLRLKRLVIYVGRQRSKTKKFFFCPKKVKRSDFED